MSTEDLELWRGMLRIRRLEEAVVRLAEDPTRPIRGHVHVSIGQEAAAVGACAALRPGDYVFTTHRNHGHVLARGGEPLRILAEILGRVDGYSHGRAGGFHVAAPTLGILHTSAIVGGAIPLAAGAAFAAQRMSTGRVSLVFFGDGAMEEGVFSETMNMAQLWRLPVIFFMENNSVSAEERPQRGSPTSTNSASGLADIPRAHGLVSQTVDGMDVAAVVAASRLAVHAARAGDGPLFIEARTVRWPGNYAASPTLLGGETDITWTWAPESAPATIRDWSEKRDPLLRYARDLLARRLVDRDTLVGVDQEARREMQDAVAAALRSPEPPADNAQNYAFA